MSPQTTRTSALGWDVTVWAMPARADSVSQDDHLVESLPGARLRVAVLDGVTPAADTPRLGGLDGAAAAAGALRTAWRAGDDLIRTAEQTGELLRCPGLDPRSQPQTCAVACDLYPARTRAPVTVVRFGDCEAWVRDREGWRSVLAGGYRTTEAARILMAWYEQNPNITLDEVVAADAELNADPSCFTNPPVGRFLSLKPQAAHVAAFDELVLCSDGARVNPERLSDLDRWLRGLRSWERERAPELVAKPHDDVTVLRVRPADLKLSE